MHVHSVTRRLRFPQVRARPERAERHPRLDQELEEGHHHGQDAGSQAGHRCAVRQAHSPLLRPHQSAQLTNHALFRFVRRRVTWLSRQGCPGSKVDRCELTNWVTLNRLDYSGYAIRFWADMSATRATMAIYCFFFNYVYSFRERKCLWLCTDIIIILFMLCNKRKTKQLQFVWEYIMHIYSIRCVHVPWTDLSKIVRKKYFE